MRRLALIAALLTGGAARAQDGRSWVIVSPNAEYAGEQVASGASCRFTVRRGEQVLWSAERCFGDRGDPRFLSADGERVLVLYAFPETKGGMEKALAGELFHRGQVVRQYRVGQFVRDYKPLFAGRKHFYWLEGALGQPGVPPGLTKDGTGVELNTLDGKRHVVHFDGRAPPMKPAPKPKKKKKKW
ncbi:MAG: hypothetical protein ACK4N5_14085 [Myxococcales bacterium]